MSAPKFDVLNIMDRVAEFGAIVSVPEWKDMPEAREAVAMLIYKAEGYYTHYMQDEAEPDAVAYGISLQQHQAACQLRDAIIACGGDL